MEQMSLTSPIKLNKIFSSFFQKSILNTLTDIRYFHLMMQWFFTYQWNEFTRLYVTSLYEKIPLCIKVVGRIHTVSQMLKSIFLFKFKGWEPQPFRTQLHGVVSKIVNFKANTLSGGGCQKAEYHMRLLWQTETGRESEGPILIWTLKPKFYWELNILGNYINHLSG